MIIKSLRATNFMKYDAIDLRDLPEKGEIAVIGENEAGKTTLGECIAFALFGRTVRTEETDPGQVISWSSDDCQTSITVHVAGKGEFRIERSVSRSGTLSARLFGPDGTVLAEDVASVNRSLSKVLGFNFPEFRYSFYVAQKEIDIIRHSRRDNTRQIVYDMLGITAVERGRTAVETEIRELKQKSETLDRDLAVARALRTSVSVEEDALKAFEQKKLDIEDDIGRALSVEQGARDELERCRGRSKARKDVLNAFERFQAAFLQDHTRRKLNAEAPALEAIAKAAEHVANETNKAILNDEKSFQHTIDKVSRLRKASTLLRELTALVQSRAAYLGAELQERPATSDDWAPRTKAEFRIASERRVEALRGGLSGNLIGLVVFGILGLIGAGLGGAILGEAIPLEAGAVPLGFTGQQVGVVLVTFGAVFLLLALFSLLKRGGQAKELKQTQDGLENLRRELQRVSEQSAACSSFRPEPLNEVEAQVRRINDETISAKFQELQSEARELLDKSGSVEQMLAAELSTEKELREARDKLHPRLSQANRLKRLADDVLERVKAAAGDDYDASGPVPEDVSGPAAKRNLDALEAPAEEVARQATQALMTLDSLTAGGEASSSKSEAAKAMRESLVRHFELCANGEEQKADFESRSRLPKLLSPQSAMSASEARDALQQEARLLAEMLGKPEELDADIRDAEDRLQSAAESRVKRENERVSLFARTENIREQMARTDELTIKIAGLENALAPISQDLAVRQELIKLYSETIEGMKARFGPNIARYIELLLPRITSNRYRRVQISPDLDIKVYSNERADFVRLIDLSFGTSDQILLALRLGLAQALVHSRGIRNGHQFMFLDEPLAAFDEERSQAFLQIMRSFDDNFSQIFVSSTTPINSDFDMVINLVARNNELLLGA